MASSSIKTVKICISLDVARAWPSVSFPFMCPLQQTMGEAKSPNSNGFLVQP